MEYIAAYWQRSLFWNPTDLQVATPTIVATLNAPTGGQKIRYSENRICFRYSRSNRPVHQIIKIN